MRKKPLKGSSRRILMILQHILIVSTAVCLLAVLTGSSVMLTGVSENYSYSMDAGEKEASFEDSLLFNHIFGRGVTDVARMVAVRSQLETNGQFDGEKTIDVTTFYYRFGGIPDRYVTVKYRLEDLIKWAQYGFEYEEKWFTGEQADKFLSRTSTYTKIDYSSGKLQGGIVTPFNAQMDEYTEEYSVSANGLENGDFHRDDTTARVLFNRYQTIDGKNIEEYTGTWEEYKELCEYIQTTAEALSDNYEEYAEYKEFYDSSQSNLRFYIIKNIGERQEIYTNIPGNHLSEKEINGLFKKYGKYLYFNPENMEYESNTLLTENTVRHVFNSFEYAYPETIKVWIGVDTSYPASDVYIQGMEGYESYMPNYWMLITSAALCAFLYFLLMFYLTVKEGRTLNEDGEVEIKLQSIDHVPTELMVAAAVLLAGGIIVALTFIYDSMSHEFYYEGWFKVAAGIAVFVCELLFAEFYYSLVRRLKADNLWKESLTFKALVNGKAAAWHIYDNGNIVAKTWLPYLAFLIINLIFVLLGWKGIAVAACLDLAFGVLLYLNTKNRQRIVEGIQKISEGDFKHKVNEENLHGDNLVLARAVNSIGEGIRVAVETSMKDERLKADLITNVSHDIKTPLTSIINYVDLIKRENIESEKVKGYVAVLDTKSQRLKQLTDDLVEASKISSGNIALHWETINLVELVNQTIGEFSEKFEQKGLIPVIQFSDSHIYIEADSRRIWRVMENLFNNIVKYAMENTRVYVDISQFADESGMEYVEFSLKNISAQPLNIRADELTERFIRGDVARSTEGSGLGLSIAKNLTEAQKGTFEIVLDGDLFKVVLVFALFRYE